MQSKLGSVTSYTMKRNQSKSNLFIKRLEFIIENIKDEIEYASKNVGMKDYKTYLQEELQKNGEIDIKYNICTSIHKPIDQRFDISDSATVKQTLSIIAYA